MKNDSEHIAGIVSDLLVALGEDLSRPGIRETPARVAKSYVEMLSGYSRNLQDEITTFENAYGYDDIIYSGEIDFFSLCEHHLLPFFGVAHIAYIPRDKIIGLSKLARAVDIYARRFQEQERITIQIADEIERLIDARGVIVVLEGRHFCSMARGVGKVSSNMKTICSRGLFKESPEQYNNFFKLIEKR